MAKKGNKMNLAEVIALTPEDAKRIEACGGDRIELISAFSQGGLTPPYDITEKVIAAVKIPVNVMIRPHSLSFAYSRQDLETMKKDIKAARDMGARGVVLGALNARGNICRKRLEKLLKSCHGLEITFHRAIDELTNPLKGLKILREYPQITNVLTSGGKGDIAGNIPLLKAMTEISRSINIMAGGGLTLENLTRIKEETGVKQFHFGRAARRGMNYEEIDEQKLKLLVRLCKE